MAIVTKRVGNVIEIGNSMGLTIRSELLDMGVKPEDPVCITLEKSGDGTKRIVIEEIEK